MLRTFQVLSLLTMASLVFALAACGSAAEPASSPLSQAAPAAEAPVDMPTAPEAPAAAPAFTGEPIRLGLQAPLSGPYAAEGLAIKQADEVHQAVADLGGQLVAHEAGNPPLSEVTALMDRVKAANPDVVYYAGTAGMAASFIRQARDAGLQVAWVLSSGANVPELASLAGPQNIAGAYIVADPLPSLLADSLAQRFLADYQAKFNAEPTLWGAMAADAGLLVEEAVRATNSTDPQVLASYLHDRLRGFAGITGEIEGFDASGDRLGTGNVVLVLTPDGRAVPSPKQP